LILGPGIKPIRQSVIPGFLKKTPFVTSLHDKTTYEKNQTLPTHNLTISVTLLLFPLVLLCGCMTPQKSANEQSRDAYWLAQSDATKQLYAAKQELQKLQKNNNQRQTMYYSVPIENPDGMNMVPHEVVIPVEK
jgi:Tfp pilus assembly protein PilN